MDMIGEIIDWVIVQVISLSGITAADLTVDNTTIHLIDNVWNYFILVGIGLTVIYFIIDLNKKWMFEGQSMSIKTIFIPFAKLVIAVIVMFNANTLFASLCSFNNGFATVVQSWFSVSGIPSISIGKKLVDSLAFWEKIILLFPIIISFAVALICNLVWVYKALTYKIELIVRTAFAPIALADIYSGLNASALKYIKGTLALIIYGGCLILLPRLTMAIACTGLIADMTQLQTNITNGTLPLDVTVNIFAVVLSYLKIMIAPIAAIGLTGAAKTITKEALGA